MSISILAKVKEFTEFWRRWLNELYDVDVKSIFRKEVEKWESEPFYMDDYAKSCLIHNDCLEMGNDS